MECDFNLLRYELFKISTTIIIFKTFLNILKFIIIVFKNLIFFICLIASWLEIGNGKKCYVKSPRLGHWRAVKSPMTHDLIPSGGVLEIKWYQIILESFRNF
jgi:hypothetical protein